MTISPPSNVVLGPDEPARVLAQGVDTLVLAIDLEWRNDQFFDLLRELKVEAKNDDGSATGKLEAGGIGRWLFKVRPNGAEGFEWLLSSRELRMSVGNWSEPKQRPSVMVTIASETLWAHGVAESVAWVESLLFVAGADVIRTKVSRLDVCTDILIPSEVWQENLHRNFVTRATKIDLHLDRYRLTGYNIGRGKIAARMYDKPVEIDQKSKKYWMYPIWGLKSVPDGHHIIRVEYQLRREGLKQYGIDLIADLDENLPGLWSALTRRWLRLVGDRAKHHTHQKLLPFWAIVQGAVPGAQDACPLVRQKAIKADESQLRSQARGLITSLTALLRQGDLIDADEVLDIESHLVEAIRSFRRDNWTDERFTTEVKGKQARFHRHGVDFEPGASARPPAGVSCRRTSPTGSPP
jgi:hypothetical protein